jgi:hypothetical protein
LFLLACGGSSPGHGRKQGTGRPQSTPSTPSTPSSRPEVKKPERRDPGDNQENGEATQKGLCRAVFEANRFDIERNMKKGASALGVCNEYLATAADGSKAHPNPVQMAVAKESQWLLNSILEFGQVSGYELVGGKTTLFHFVIIKGYLESLEILASQSAGKLDAKNADGLTFLAIAMYAPDPEKTCELLLKHGADVKVTVTINGTTFSPLDLGEELVASKKASQRLIDILLKYGAKKQRDLSFKSKVETCLETFLPEDSTFRDEFRKVRQKIEKTCYFPGFESILGQDWEGANAPNCRLDNAAKEDYQDFSKAMYGALKKKAPENSADKCKLKPGADEKDCNDRHVHFNTCVKMSRMGKNLDTAQEAKTKL